MIYLIKHLCCSLYHQNNIPSFPQSKLNESQFQLTPWHSEANSLTLAMQSSAHSDGAALASPVCIKHLTFFIFFMILLAISYIFSRFLLEPKKWASAWSTASFYSWKDTHFFFWESSCCSEPSDRSWWTLAENHGTWWIRGLLNFCEQVSFVDGDFCNFDLNIHITTVFIAGSSFKHGWWIPLLPFNLNRKMLKVPLSLLDSWNDQDILVSTGYSWLL